MIWSMRTKWPHLRVFLRNRQLHIGLHWNQRVLGKGFNDLAGSTSAGLFFSPHPHLYLDLSSPLAFSDTSIRRCLLLMQRILNFLVIGKVFVLDMKLLKFFSLILMPYFFQFSKECFINFLRIFSDLNSLNH